MRTANCEVLRKSVYLVAGILPAIGFGVFSLMVLMFPPLIPWTLAAWIGVAGLVKAFGRQPYERIHGPTSVMLICGVIAMVPFVVLMLHELPNAFVWRDDYGVLLMIVASIGTVLVALHFLYYQASVLIADWILTLTIGATNYD